MTIAPARTRETVTTTGGRTHDSITSRIGMWSAAHWKTATATWLVLVALAFAAGNMLGTTTIDPTDALPGESGRVSRIVAAGFDRPAGESVLIQSTTVHLDDAAFRAAVADVTTALATSGDVQNVRSPVTDPGPGTVSADRRSALVSFDVRGAAKDAPPKVGPIVTSVDAIQARHPDLYIGEFGAASSGEAVRGALGADLKQAGILSIPITLGILLVAFGALVAAGIPLLLALTAVAGALGLVGISSRLLPADPEVAAIVLLIGLAVGVDYSMFYLKRERQERAAGRTPQAALAAAAATSGRSVLISGLTVMVAMAGMFLTGDATFASFGLATMMVVAVAMVGSLTVLPALLSRLGDNVDRLHLPFLGAADAGDGAGRFWTAIIVRVLRRPVVSIVLAGGLLLALAAPALQLRIEPDSTDTLPQSLPVVQTYNRLQHAFPGAEVPATVVIKAADVAAPAVTAAVEQLRRRALDTGLMHEPVTVDINPARTVAVVSIPVEGAGTDATSNQALDALRDTIVPATVATVAGTETGVGGTTAISRDTAESFRSALPPVFGFVLILAFLLMLVAFRSIVIAVKAVVLNLLSVGAAYGVLVLVFEDGWGKGLLGFTHTGGISAIMPILLFVILFGLSMDYHVFIVSRIRELHDAGASSDDAVTRGITSTAGVVTSAAVVMVAVFAVFASLQMLFLKQFGVGLATAVLIDATLVRAVLLPATMKLLGDTNWYLPRWLQWLPHLEHTT